MSDNPNFTRMRFKVLGSSPDLDAPLTCPPGISVLDHDKTYFFDAEGVAELSLLIEIVRGVAIPVLAMWLYDHFIKRGGKTIAKKIIINETVITFVSRDEFIQVVQKEMEHTEE